MKSIKFTNQQFFSKGLLVPLCTGAALLFLTLTMSCNKESSISAIGNNSKALMSTGAFAATASVSVVPHAGDEAERFS